MRNWPELGSRCEKRPSGMYVGVPAYPGRSATSAGLLTLTNGGGWHTPDLRAFERLRGRWPSHSCRRCRCSAYQPWLRMVFSRPSAATRPPHFRLESPHADVPPTPFLQEVPRHSIALQGPVGRNSPMSCVLLHMKGHVIGGLHMKNATIKFLLPNAFPISKTGFYNEIKAPKVKISPRGFS